MFNRLPPLDETYFSSVFEMNQHDTHYLEITYYEGLTSDESVDEPVVGIRVAIYEDATKQRRKGYAANQFAESTLRHERTLRQRLLSKVVRGPPTSVETFIRNKIEDAYATTHMGIVSFELDSIVEEMLTKLEVEGAYQSVNVDIWEDYNTGSYEESEELLS